MSTPSTNPLTAAEKRKITIAAKADQERREIAAFDAASKKNGGRKAKADAKSNAIWNLDQSGTAESRKRTLSESATLASETIKKARGAKKTSGEQPAPKAKAGRTHVAADIDDSEDSLETKKKPVHIDFTKLVPTKVKSGSKVKAVVAKGVKVFTVVKARSTRGGKANKVAAAKPRLIAESASEEEAVSSDQHDTDAKSDDSEDDNAQDVSPNEDEFEAEMSDKHGSASELFDSDNESIEIDKPRIKSKGKGRQREHLDPDTDNTFSDAPPRVVNIDSDADMPAPVTKISTSLRSRRSSAASWLSGQDLRVPDSDADDDFEASIQLPPKKNGKSRSAQVSEVSSRRGSTTSRHSMAIDSDEEVKLVTKKKSTSRKNYGYGGDDMQLHEAIAKGLSTIPVDVEAPDSTEEAVSAPKKARKVSAARQKKAELERPEVRPGTVAPAKGVAAQLDRIAAAAVDAASRPESEWDISARIMFPAPGKDIGLTSQTEELKSVLRGSIEFIKLSLFFEDAYPAIVSRAGFARSYLLSAAQTPASAHIKDRLETDLSFAARLADIPLDRINITRGDFKRVAAQEIPGLFRFAHLPPAEVRNIVADRLQDHRYIFPVDLATNRLKVELPFHHESIVGVLKKVVFTGQFRTKNLHLFASTSKKHPNRAELPDAMVCLAATAVYGALVEYRATGTLQNIPFTEGTYEDIYRNHMKTLIETRESVPVALHRVLHKLYNLVSETAGATANATASSSVLINLVEECAVNARKLMMVRGIIWRHYPKLGGNGTVLGKEVFPDDAVEVYIQMERMQ
ncbi:hypothetical protein B0H16DRAFT_1458133 [Mycena metata]|uniref:DUF6532 domain-containing protein n=1 Tax=Mycena metata TaxID=1033252 RepID=A0AAD7J421_9AGAR|nr:hypothetical protein B0H16DRAFT_1458133 [Mycena metata]